MSQGARLTAVIVVVAVAAIGLYFAVMAPPAQPTDGTTDAAVAIAELAPAGAGTSLDGAGTAPPAEAFAPPSAPIAAGQGTSTAATGSGAAATGPATVSGGTGVTPTGTTGVATIVSPSGTEPATWTAPAAPAAPASTRSYVIKSGDTLEGIARAELGDGQRWRTIVDLNPGLDPKSLKIGRSITLPEGSAPTRTASATAEPATGKKAAASASGSTYTVQKGDTLFGIARKVYGSAGDAEVKRIVSANSGTLKSKDTPLKPGMKLTIPAKP